MIGDDESERFRKLANESPEEIYDAIAESNEPWWGFNILAQNRMSKYWDDERIRKLIHKHYEFMLSTIRTSSEPWLVIWNMQPYDWFFERKETQDALAHAISTSTAPAQVFGDIKHIRAIMKNEKVRSSFIHAMSTTENPASLLTVLRDYPRFLAESRMIETISTRLQSMGEFCWLLIEVSRFRVLAENSKIQEAIKTRMDDLLDVFENHTMNWQIIPSLAHMDSIMKEPRIIEAIAAAIRKCETPYNLLHKIRLEPNITSQTAIQNAVAYLFNKAPAAELWKALSALNESKLLVESEIIREVVKQRIDVIVQTIAEHEHPHVIIDGLAYIHYIMNDGRVKQAITNSLDKIINASNASEYGIYWVWSYFEKTIWNPEISENKALRRLIVSEVIMDDRYGNYVSRMEDYPTLLHDEIIIDGITSAIRTFDNPAWFIVGLEKIPVLLENTEIRSEIEKRIPRIIKEMWEEDEYEYLTEEVSNTEFLMEYDKIRQTVVERIKSTPTSWKIIAGLPDTLLNQEFVKEIIQNGLEELAEQMWSESNNSPNFMLLGLQRSEVVLASSEVQDMFAQYMESLIEELDNVWEVWYDINTVASVPFYFENDRIKKSIRNRSKDLAHALNVRDDSWHLLETIGDVLEFLDRDLIVEAVVLRLNRCYDPWGFLDNSNLSEFLKESKIREVLINRIPDIVFGITSTGDAKAIVFNLEKVPFLKSDERIADAISDYKKRIT